MVLFYIFFKSWFLIIICVCVCVCNIKLNLDSSIFVPNNSFATKIKKLDGHMRKIRLQLKFNLESN